MPRLQPVPTGLNRSAAGSWPPLSMGEQPGSSGSEPEDLKNPPPNPKHPRIPATLPAVAHGSLLPALHVGRLVARGRRRRLQHGALRRGELRRHQGAAGAERGGEGGLALLTHAWGRTEGISRGGAGCCRYPPLLPPPPAAAGIEAEESAVAFGPRVPGFHFKQLHRSRICEYFRAERAGNPLPPVVSIGRWPHFLPHPHGKRPGQ